MADTNRIAIHGKAALKRILPLPVQAEKDNKILMQQGKKLLLPEGSYTVMNLEGIGGDFKIKYTQSEMGAEHGAVAVISRLFNEK
jgi:hypothetical protein